MKCTFFLSAWCCVVMAAAPAHAFSVIYEQTVSGEGIDNPQTKTVMIRDDKLRMEMDSPNGEMITICEGTTIYSYAPEKNVALRLTNKAAPRMETLARYGEYLSELGSSVIGEETVEGYECVIHEFTDPRTNMDSRAWLWKGKNFPIKVETVVPDGMITTLMTDVRLGADIPDEAFAIPEGVKIIEAEDVFEAQGR